MVSTSICNSGSQREQQSLRFLVPTFGQHKNATDFRRLQRYRNLFVPVEQSTSTRFHSLATMYDTSTAGEKTGDQGFPFLCAAHIGQYFDVAA